MHQWCWKYSQSRACLLATACRRTVSRFRICYDVVVALMDSLRANPKWGYKLLRFEAWNINLWAFNYFENVLLIYTFALILFFCTEFAEDSWNEITLTVFVSFKIECLSKMAYMYYVSKKKDYFCWKSLQTHKIC